MPFVQEYDELQELQGKLEEKLQELEANPPRYRNVFLLFGPRAICALGLEPRSLLSEKSYQWIVCGT